MNESELTPIRRDVMGSYVMMYADMETIPTTYDPMVGKINPQQLRQPFTSASRALTGMATILSLTGNTSETAIKAAATFQMIGAGIEITAGLQSLYKALTALKTAEAMAHLAKYGPFIAVFLAGALVGVAAYARIMESQEYNFSGDYSGALGQRQLQAQIAQEGIRNGR
jgi:hypothetical protein